MAATYTGTTQAFVAGNFNTQVPVVSTICVFLETQRAAIRSDGEGEMRDTFRLSVINSFHPDRSSGGLGYGVGEIELMRLMTINMRSVRE